MLYARYPAIPEPRAHRLTADKQLDERYYMPKYSSLGKCAELRSNILFVFLIIIYYHDQPGAIRRRGNPVSDAEKIALLA